MAPRAVGSDRGHPPPSAAQGSVTEIPRLPGVPAPYRGPMGIEIRPIPVERVDEFNLAVYHGFHNATVDERDLEVRRERWLDGRWFAADDGGRIVATFRSLPLATTMPGGSSLTSCGLTAVGTRATHRRQGLMGRMMRDALADGRDRGEPVTTLIAAEYGIYGRFGFGAATEHATYTIDARVPWLTDGEGTVEFAEADEFRREAPAVYERHRGCSVSELALDDWVWDRKVHGFPSEPSKDFRLLCRDDSGAVVGYAMYTIEDKWDGRRPEVPVTVGELIADTPAYEARLWRFVCELDWVTTVTAGDRSVEERLGWWLADGRAARQTLRADFVWARPLDTPACLRARSYAAPADVVIDVIDPLGLSGGRFRLDCGPHGVACMPTAAAADLTLPIATLGSVLFGGHSLAALHRAGLAEEHRAGTVDALATAMRTPVAPWSASWF